MINDPLQMGEGAPLICPEALGSIEFRRSYQLKYAYLAGAMYKGIASKEMIVELGKAGLMGFLGSGGMKLQQLDSDIQFIQKNLGKDCSYGVNLLHTIDQPDLELNTVQLLLMRGVRHVEAAAFMEPTKSLVLFRFKGVRRLNSEYVFRNRILAKVSRPEVAAAFMSPPPPELVFELLSEGALTNEEADAAANCSLATDICVEADSGGHTDQGVAYALIPTIIRLRDEIAKKYKYNVRIHVGAAGGIGTPEAAAAAFILGAEFVLTGSINQCTVEAATSNAVKNLLQNASVQDTAYAPAGDMFELGAKVQVLRRGLFFPARANKLYELYSRHASIEDLDEKTKEQLETKYFRKTLGEIWNETKSYYIRSGRKTEADLEQHGKQKMALIFRWYFIYASRLAFGGDESHRVDYQIHCGPAMGAFNEWVKGTELEKWQNRRVAEIGIRIMEGAAEVLEKHYRNMINIKMRGLN